MPKVRRARDAEKERSQSRLPQMKKKTIRIMLTTSQGNQDIEMARDNLFLSLFSAIQRKIKVDILRFLILAVKVVVSAQIQKNATHPKSLPGKVFTKQNLKNILQIKSKRLSKKKS
jgi:hypothetical protein